MMYAKIIIISLCLLFASRLSNVDGKHKKPPEVPPFIDTIYGRDIQASPRRYTKRLSSMLGDSIPLLNETLIILDPKLKNMKEYWEKLRESFNKNKADIPTTSKVTTYTGVNYFLVGQSTQKSSWISRVFKQDKNGFNIFTINSPISNSTTESCTQVTSSTSSTSQSPSYKSLFYGTNTPAWDLLKNIWTTPATSTTTTHLPYLFYTGKSTSQSNICQTTTPRSCPTTTQPTCQTIAPCSCETIISSISQDTTLSICQTEIVTTTEPETDYEAAILPYTTETPPPEGYNYAGTPELTTDSKVTEPETVSTGEDLNLPTDSVLIHQPRDRTLRTSTREPGVSNVKDLLSLFIKMRKKYLMDNKQMMESEADQRARLEFQALFKNVGNNIFKGLPFGNSERIHYQKDEKRLNYRNNRLLKNVAVGYL